MDDTYVINFESKFLKGDSIFMSKEYKGVQKLTLKLCEKNNNKVIELLKDSYDNTIIIDNKSEYLIVIHNLPMSTYFKIIENKNKGYYTDFELIHYSSKKIQKYINKKIPREAWYKLNQLDLFHNIISSKEQTEEIIDNDNNEVSYDKAPLYDNYLYYKSHQSKFSKK